MEIVTDYPKLLPPVVSSVPPVVIGGLRLSVSTGRSFQTRKLQIRSTVNKLAELREQSTCLGELGQLRNSIELLILHI